jgi:hypothetical protein
LFCSELHTSYKEHTPIVSYSKDSSKKTTRTHKINLSLSLSLSLSQTTRWKEGPAFTNSNPFTKMLETSKTHTRQYKVPQIISLGKGAEKPNNMASDYVNSPILTESDKQAKET